MSIPKEREQDAQVEVTPDAESRKLFGDLPLKEMNYSGEVSGTTANMGLELKYQNNLENPVEAVFTFPLMPEATVTDVVMRVGERTVNAELREREEARERYEEARDAGHHASLMEEERPNIFTMSVGGVDPGEEVQVELKCMHRVDWQNGGGRLTIPMVVAPRFIHGDPAERSQGPGWSPDTSAVPDASKITPIVAGDPDQITYQASLNLQLKPGFDALVACPSHDALIAAEQHAQGETVNIELENLRPDRDLTITYQNLEREATINVDTAQWNGANSERENFCMIQVAPPLTAQANTQEREVVLCLDRSYSMQGLAIDGLRRVTKKIIERLGADASNVKLGIVTFNESANVLQEMGPLNEGKEALERVSEIEADGGTSISTALKKALGLFDQARPENIERSIVLVTDGETTDFEVSRDGREDIRVHCVGISSAVEHHVLQDIAKLTGGSTYWIYPGEDYDVATREIVSRTSGPLLRKLEIDGLGAEVELLGGKEVWKEQPQVLYARVPNDLPKSLTIRGIGQDGQPFEVQTDVPQDGRTFGAVPQLWARELLRGDIADERATEVSLRYGVLGRTTAYVGVMEKEVPGMKPTRVDIPVALPHGWEMEAQWAGGMHKGAVRALGAVAMACDSMELCASIDFTEEVEADAFLDADVVPNSIVQVVIHSQPLTNSVDAFYQHLRGMGTSGDSRDEHERWAEIELEVAQEAQSDFASWSPEEKAKLFELLVLVRDYGFKLDMPSALRERPASEGVAFKYWSAGQRALGVQVLP